MQAGGAATAAPTLAAEPRWQHRDLAVELDRLAALAGGHAELQPRIKAAREQLDALAIEVEALARSIDSAPMEAPHQAAEGEPPPAREQSPHGGIWGHFTERARRAVFFAQEEAARRGVHQVEPEHLLLGLLRDECVPVDVLQHLGVEPSAVLHGLEQHLSRGSGEPEAEMQLTAPARRVIDRAFEESRRLGSAVIGCQHLLLGILGETEGVTARLFAGLGVDLETAREAVARGQ
jgi:hypothetical protein